MNTEETNPHSTAMIVSNYLRHHTLRPEQLSDLITTVHHALSHLGQPIQTEEVLTPAVSVRRSVHHDYVVCLDSAAATWTRQHAGLRDQARHCDLAFSKI
jgi:predicted transcriptional regulator